MPRQFNTMPEPARSKQPGLSAKHIYTPLPSAEMNQAETIKGRSKFDDSCFVKRIYGIWVLGLYFKGLKREIQPDDLYGGPAEEKAQPLANQLERNWNEQLKRKSPSFAWASIKTFGWLILPSVSLILFEECVLNCIKPIFLADVIRFFADPAHRDYEWACWNALGVVGCSVGYVLCHHPACYGGVRVAIKARVAWCTLMYRKAIRLNSSAFSHTTVGQILNLMSNDVGRLDEFFIIGSYGIAAPIQTVISMAICYFYIGPVCLIGLAILLFFIPFNSFNGRLFLAIRTKVAQLSDTRIRMINEVIKAMAIIKMYAWEKHFSKLISDARKREMNKIKLATFLRAMNISISVVSGRIILFAVFLTYVLQGNALHADVVFVLMNYINTLRHTMTWMFPNTVALYSELTVSCHRIQTFLLLEEVKQVTDDGENRYHRVRELSSRDEAGIELRDASVQWTLEQHQPSLRKMNVSLQPGELLAVIGSVGSGKSTLLMSLMNEVEITSGSISVRGHLAYASQEPWSFNASVQENILFGKPMDADKYARVISVCAMKRDLKLFPYGDRTLVGERGVSLSGGQKARITLARALYNDADVYLLDDPLSAVDPEVAKHIFEKCITDYLKKKAVILVTHQIQFIKQASKVLVLKEGEQVAYGTYEQIINQGIDLMAYIHKPSDKVQEQELKPEVERQASVASLVMQVTRNRTCSILSTKSFAESVDVDEGDFKPQVEQEEKGSGALNKRIYLDYIRAGSGTFLMVSMLVSTIVSQAIFHYNDIWLAQWSNREDRQSHNENETYRVDASQRYEEEEWNIIIYSTLIIAQLVGMLIRSGTFFLMCIHASMNLHNKIFFCVMRAPMSFFDTIPTGRILNRFTKDLGIIDELLPLAACDLNLIMTQVIGSVIVVALSKWYLVFPALVMLASILVVRWAYIKTARDLKRYENMSRSPIYNHMTITLNGLATIRAFEAENMFIEQYYRYQNDHTSTYFMCFASSRLLGLAMDFICILYLIVVTVFLMLFYDGVESGTAGLALSMALGLTGMTQWGVRQSAEVENHMTSVERILEYSKIKPEASLVSKYRFPKDWPRTGNLVFKNVSLTYHNAREPVLRQLNFEIRGGEKIGIVGRTGAGKSSILAALFRMVEVSGKIILDDVPCHEIGLHELRSNISIIPQEPVAFIGTLRKNLDPFDEHSDEQLWQVLEEVQLKKSVQEMNNQLGYVLSEGGGNLSVGQRQLICLARALLRRNKVICLDEASANCDIKTDSLIQRTIRRNFAKCTIITIAHRLNTIIDSDRVLVLDAGRVVQFDTPHALLQQHEGIFHHLVEQTGPQMAARLTAMAAEARDGMSLLRSQENNERD